MSACGPTFLPSAISGDMYPVVPAIFLLASLFLLGNYMLSQPRVFGWNVLVILLGLPVYWFWEKRKHE